MALSKNNLARSSHIEKICLWTKFQPPTWILALSGPIFLFWLLNTTPIDCTIQNINQSGLHALQNYAPGPSFSLSHGSWLCQDQFSCFSHQTLPLKMVPSKHKPARSSHITKICPWTKFQSPSWLIRTRLPVSATKQTIPIDGAIQK